MDILQIPTSIQPTEVTETQKTSSTKQKKTVQISNNLSTNGASIKTTETTQTINHLLDPNELTNQRRVKLKQNWRYLIVKSLINFNFLYPKLCSCK